MVERPRSERVSLKTVMAERLLIDLIDAQKATSKAKRKPSKINLDEADIFQRMLEGTLTSASICFDDTEIIRTVRAFLDAEDFKVLPAVKVWSDPSKNPLDYETILDRLHDLGIKNEAMDFLAQGLPLLKSQHLAESLSEQALRSS